MKKFGIIFSVLMLLSACKTKKNTPGDTTFEGKYIVESIEGVNNLEEKPTFIFANGIVNGSTGCNSYGGSYKVSKNTIVFSDLRQTEMACKDYIMKIENRFNSLLEKELSCKFQEDEVHFLQNGELVMIAYLFQEEE